MAGNLSSISYNKPTSRTIVEYEEEIWPGFEVNKDFEKPYIVGYYPFTAYKTGTDNEDAHGVMLSIDSFQDGLVTISAELWMKYGEVLAEEAVSMEANKRVKDGFKQSYMNVQDGDKHPLFTFWKTMAECVLLRKKADLVDGKKPTRKDGDKEVEIDFNYVLCTRKEAKSRNVKARISDKEWSFNLRCMSESLKAGYDVTEELKEASKKSSTQATNSDELPE